MSLRLVPPLPAGTPGDPGLTGPGSVTWRISRERVAPLCGLRWSMAQQALWWLFTHATHVVMGRLAPARLRFWAHYRVAVARCHPPADPSVAVPSGQLGSGER